MKGVQCYELFGGIALKNHTFSFSFSYNMIVHLHLEYATTYWNTYTKCNIDKLEAVQRRAARFASNFHVYRPTADLNGKIQISLQ